MSDLQRTTPEQCGRQNIYGSTIKSVIVSSFVKHHINTCARKCDENPNDHDYVHINEKCCN